MTFDDAQDSFRDDPSGDNAARYLELTVAYWRDAMIGDDTLVAAVEEVALTIVTIWGSPDASHLSLYNAGWAKTFYEDQTYAVTVDLDGEWSNLVAIASANGGVLIKDMGERFVKTFIAARAMKFGINGHALLNADLKGSRDATIMVADCTIAMGGGTS